MRKHVVVNANRVRLVRPIYPRLVLSGNQHAKLGGCDDGGNGDCEVRRAYWLPNLSLVVQLAVWVPL